MQDDAVPSRVSSDGGKGLAAVGGGAGEEVEAAGTQRQGSGGGGVDASGVHRGAVINGQLRLIEDDTRAAGEAALAVEGDDEGVGDVLECVAAIDRRRAGHGVVRVERRGAVNGILTHVRLGGTEEEISRAGAADGSGEDEGGPGTNLSVVGGCAASCAAEEIHGEGRAAGEGDAVAAAAEG